MNCNELKNLIDIKEKAILEHERQESEKSIRVKKEFDLIKYDLLDVIVEASVEKKYCYSIGVEGLHRELSIQSMNTEDLSYLIARTGIPLRVSEKRGWFYENQSYA